MLKKTFLCHEGALGDLLLSLPAIHAIRVESSFLHLAAGNTAAALLKAAGCADEISDAGSIFYASFHMSDIETGLADFLADFDRSFIFSKEAGFSLARQIERIIPETHTIITIPPAEIREHIPFFRLEQLPDYFSQKTSFPGIAVPRFYVEDAEKILIQSGYNPGMPLIAIHPGSGGRTKNWDVERFFELADQLSSRHSCFTVFISGPAEPDASRQEIEGFVHKRKNMAMHLKDADLIVVAALLQTSSLYIGNDSGITHLAASANNRVIALYGPTDPILWAPFNKNTQIISSQKECAPCGEARHACKNCDCLSEITVSRVYVEAVSLLEQGQEL